MRAPVFHVAILLSALGQATAKPVNPETMTLVSPYSKNCDGWDPDNPEAHTTCNEYVFQSYRSKGYGNCDLYPWAYDSWCCCVKTLGRCLVEHGWKTEDDFLHMPRNTDGLRNTVIWELHAKGQGSTEELQAMADGKLVELCDKMGHVLDGVTCDKSAMEKAIQEAETEFERVTAPGEKRACSTCPATEGDSNEKAAARAALNKARAQWDQCFPPDLCHCTGNGNEIRCSKTGRRYCASDEKCFADREEDHPFGLWAKLCKKK